MYQRRHSFQSAVVPRWLCNGAPRTCTSPILLPHSNKIRVHLRLASKRLCAPDSSRASRVFCIIYVALHYVFVFSSARGSVGGIVPHLPSVGLRVGVSLESPSFSCAARGLNMLTLSFSTKHLVIHIRLFILKYSHVFANIQELCIRFLVLYVRQSLPYLLFTNPALISNNFAIDWRVNVQMTCASATENDDEIFFLVVPTHIVSKYLSG